MFDGHGSFGGGFMWLFWIVIIVAFFMLVKGIMAGGSSSSQPESPMEILRKRYAAGEITKEQYESMRKDLEK